MTVDAQSGVYLAEDDVGAQLERLEGEKRTKPCGILTDRSIFSLKRVIDDLRSIFCFSIDIRKRMH